MQLILQILKLFLLLNKKENLEKSFPAKEKAYGFETRTRTLWLWELKQQQFQMCLIFLKGVKWNVVSLMDETDRVHRSS